MTFCHKFTSLTPPLANERGSALILALLLLAVLTVIGVTSTNTSSIELKIVQNERIYQKNFYKAEAAVFEAAQRLESESDPDELRPATTTFTWLKDDSLDLENLTVITVNSASSFIDAVNTRYASTAKGIVEGGSLDMTKSSNLYGFEVFGLSQEQKGRVFIKIGYKKRY